MAAGAVIEGLDVVEDRGAGVSPRGEASTVNEFVFRLLQNASMAALSYQLPLRLIEATRPYLASAAR